MNREPRFKGFGETRRAARIVLSLLVVASLWLPVHALATALLAASPSGTEAVASGRAERQGRGVRRRESGQQVTYGGREVAVMSSSTTTTEPPFPTTTLSDGCTDVSQGGRFRGGFARGNYDPYCFELVTPVVLTAETSNSLDGCPGDTIMDLRLDGVVIALDDESGPQHCSRLQLRLTEPGIYEIRVYGFQSAGIPKYTLDVEFTETECGNDVLELLEQCDDGNVAGGDCCASDCTLEPDASPCSDGRLCNGEDSCSGGFCIVHAANPCLANYGDYNCLESCSDDFAGCQAPDPDGSPCDDGVFCNGLDQCSGGVCNVHTGDPCRGPDNDGNCLETCKELGDSCSAFDPNGTPCDDNNYCNGTDTCQFGSCGIHTGNPCTGADGDADCRESCDNTKETCLGPDPNGSPCTDGLFCTGADSCSGGLCSLHAGNGCAGPDGDSNCVESCNEAADNCSAFDPLGSPCNDGIFCNGADTCSGGTCSVHAGNPCPGADGDENCSESCDETTDACTAPDPNGSSCIDGLFCNGADTCSGGSCSTHVGDPCPGADGDGNCAESCNETTDTCTAADPNASACTDSVFCNGLDTCSGGVCSSHAGDPCIGPDGDGNCAESCDESSDACTAADPNAAPCNDGVFCNGSDTCSAGACSVHSGDPCLGPDGDGNCSESCNEAGDSCTGPDPNGSACTDSLFCNGSDTCSGGTCSGHTGTPCPGPDGDGNCAETCNESADACSAPDPDGSACSDGLFCTGADTCSGGACSIHAGSTCPGADGDGNCAETCNEAADNCSSPDAAGSACDDGVFCNGTDTCSGGTCSVHTGNPCPGADGDDNCSESCNEAGDTCTAADQNGSACADGLFCNGSDSCSSGACSVHAGNPCTGADGDGNCSESCSEIADNCSAADPNGTTCNDGLACNGADTCSGGFCTVHSGTQCPGADGDGNCAESCSDTTGGCTGADPAGSPCDDGIFCNGPDTCLAGSCSVHAGNPCPGADGDGNCAESCNETSDSCTAPDTNGSACNDGTFCNGNDSCAAGACSAHAGNPCPGPDGDGNCSEVCNEAADACTSPDPDGSACNDALHCNGPDTCASGACSAHSGNPCPGPDGDGNCSESCNEAADACTAAELDGSPCNDGLFCTGTDACSAGACSVHTGNDCVGADGDANCAESCNEASDACNGPDQAGSACDDGLFCNGDDSCGAGACSVHAGSPCPGPDGDANCLESCDEAADSCTAPDTNDSACNDAIFCNGSDTCSAGACTTHPGDPCPGPDGDADCTESCNETADACTAADPLGTPCENSELCTIDDTCDGSGNCADGTNVDCDDGDECTADSCIKDAPHCAHDAVPNCPPTTTMPPAIVCGDANGDDNVIASDALAVLRSAVGGPQCDARLCACDVNGNQLVQASDALAVLRFAVGIPVVLACDC